MSNLSLHVNTVSCTVVRAQLRGILPGYLPYDFVKSIVGVGRMAEAQAADLRRRVAAMKAVLNIFDEAGITIPADPNYGLGSPHNIAVNALWEATRRTPPARLAKTAFKVMRWTGAPLPVVLEAMRHNTRPRRIAMAVRFGEKVRTLQWRAYHEARDSWYDQNQGFECPVFPQLAYSWREIRETMVALRFLYDAF